MSFLFRRRKVFSWSFIFFRGWTHVLGGFWLFFSRSVGNFSGVRISCQGKTYCFAKFLIFFGWGYRIGVLSLCIALSWWFFLCSCGSGGSLWCWIGYGFLSCSLLLESEKSIIRFQEFCKMGFLRLFQRTFYCFANFSVFSFVCAVIDTDPVALNAFKFTIQ